MRERLDELCAIERGSASEGEKHAAEWLAGELREAGAGKVRVEEEPAPTGRSGGRSACWPAPLPSPASPPAAAVASRALFAAATGAAAAALSADELPPGRRRFRRLLPKRSCHHVLGEIGPPDAERTIVLMAHHDAAHTAFFFNPAITEAVGESAPWVFEQNDTSPPLMWPVVGAPALVAAGALLGSRSLTGLGTFFSAGGRRSWRTSAPARSSPAPTTTAPAASPSSPSRGRSRERPPENTRVLFLSTSEEALCEGMGLFMERHAAELRPTGPSSSAWTRSARRACSSCGARGC